MIRSGPQSPTACATWANGHAAGSSQAWYFFSQSLTRQPVSPITAMRRIGPAGSGRTWPSTDAASVPNGTVASHAVTGKASEAATRRDIPTSRLSIDNAGHSPSTMTRAISLPSGPNWSHAGGNAVVDSVGSGDATGVPSCAETLGTTDG